MKTINFLKTNLINIIGWSAFIGTVLSIVICFAGAALAGNNLIAHFNF